jgi:hypothetical protein
MTHNNHPRQRLLAGRICTSVERAHARDEDARITAAVRMIHSDEFPAAPLSPVRPHAVPNQRRFQQIDTGRLRDPAYTVTISKNRQARPCWFGPAARLRISPVPRDQAAVSRDQLVDFDGLMVTPYMTRPDGPLAAWV